MWILGLTCNDTNFCFGDEIMKCDNSNKSSPGGLSCGLFCFTIIFKTKFGKFFQFKIFVFSRVSKTLSSGGNPNFSRTCIITMVTTADSIDQLYQLVLFPSSLKPYIATRVRKTLGVPWRMFRSAQISLQYLRLSPYCLGIPSTSELLRVPLEHILKSCLIFEKSDKFPRQRASSENSS